MHPQDKEPPSYASSRAVVPISQAVVPQPQQLQPVDLNEIQGLGALLAQSGYFADAKQAAQAGVKVLAGRELGIPPIAAMMGIHIISGKIALGGNLIASRIRAHGYNYRHKQFDNNGCVLEFLDKPDRNGTRAILGESSFTKADADAAGVSNPMYKKFPRNMYFNRAISNGARWFTPEVFAGAPVYTPEELGAQNIDENGDLVQSAPPANHQQNTPAQQADLAQKRIAEEQVKRDKAAADAEAEFRKQQQQQPAADWRANFQVQMAKLLDHIGEEGLGDLLQAAGHASLNDLKTKPIAADFWRRFAQPALEKPKPTAADESEEIPGQAEEAGQ